MADRWYAAIFGVVLGAMAGAPARAAPEGSLAGIAVRPPPLGGAAITAPPAVPEGFALIRPGLFRRGSPDDEPGHDADESPTHPVHVTRPFLIGATEVTRGDWRALLRAVPRRPPGCDDRCPVERVNWYEAVAWLNALSAVEGRPACYVLRGCEGLPGDGAFTCAGADFAGLDCQGYRLPTEAEWEYAARAGTQTTRYSAGDDEAALASVAWYAGNSQGRLRPVGGRAPNRWGVWDAHGNALEWVFDVYAPYRVLGLGPLRDPTGPALADLRRRDRKARGARVVRGGSFWSDVGSARAAERGGVLPDRALDGLGFRLARTWTGGDP
ncbi:MAG: formylglycine-generating enzyme family protein [Myxococcales bacterium]|nr:formylglycine-generating enzyme family protein [Myxococcales bacterium]